MEPGLWQRGTICSCVWKVKSEFELCWSFCLSCQVLQSWEQCEKCWRASYLPYPFHFQLRMTVTWFAKVNLTRYRSKEGSNEGGYTALTFPWIPLKLSRTKAQRNFYVKYPYLAYKYKWMNGYRCWLMPCYLLPVR